MCVFHGVVRNHAEGRPVTRLDYEAHESLAQKEMERVLGDVAVCVAASAAHREEAFAACRKAIDRIKETVPIWKKEWGPGDQSSWVNLED